MGHNIHLAKANPQKHLLIRFLGAILVPTIFLCIAISFGLLNLHRQYHFTQKEIVGTHAVKLLFDATIELQKVRGLSRIVSWSKASDLEAQRLELMVNFKRRLGNLQSQESIHEFGLENEVASILLEVQDLFEVKNHPSIEGKTFEKYSVIIEKLNGIVLMVANRSNLILDPELDTYYLMEVAVKQIPDLCEAFGSVRGLGSGIIGRGSNTAIEQELFKEKVSVMYDQLNRFKRTGSIIQAASPTARSFLQDREKKLKQTLSTFLQPCGALEGFNCNLPVRKFFQRGTNVIDVLVETFNFTTDLLQQSLKQRLVEYKQYMFLTLLLSVVTIAAIFYFSLSFYRLQKDSYRKLEEISITDPLTSIPNRRYMDMVFDSEIQRIRRDGKGLAFGLMDIDFFKPFNDTYGHQEGDLALQKVAGALESSLQRAGDFYFRFGGEEFCFLINAPSLVEAKATGERIRKAVERLEIEHRENSVSRFVTISLGVAFYPEVTTENLDDMIKQADDLLYKAKENGRNQCVAVDQTL